MKKIFTKQFKQAVIALLIQDKDFLQEAASIVKPEYFDEQLHIYSVEHIITSFLKTGDAPSRTALFNDLVNSIRSEVRADGKEKEEKLVLAPCGSFLEAVYKPLENSGADVKDQFLEFCRNEDIKNKLIELHAGIDSGSIDYHGVMSEVRNSYLRSNPMLDTGLDFFKTIPSFGEDMKVFDSKSYTTGFPTLDRKMGGGFRPGTLTTFIAPPKGGKSMMLVNIGYYNLLRNKKVMAFTLEISKERLRQRYVSRISKIPIQELAIRSEEAISECQRFYDLHKPSLLIKEYPTGGASCDTFRSHLYRLKHSIDFTPDVILIDYGDIVKPCVSRYEEERSDLKGVYEEMRALASEFQCGVVTASQCNREGAEKQTVRMNHVAESWGKVMVADHIISLSQTEVESQSSRARLFFAGSREAESGGATIPVITDWKTCSVRENTLKKMSDAGDLNNALDVPKKKEETADIDNAFSS